MMLHNAKFAGASPNVDYDPQGDEIIVLTNHVADDASFEDAILASVARAADEAMADVLFIDGYVSPDEQHDLGDAAVAHDLAVERYEADRVTVAA